VIRPGDEQTNALKNPCASASGRSGTEVAATLRWFESDEIKKTLDRAELESNLD
jgi:hypothetical protein